MKVTYRRRPLQPPQVSTRRPRLHPPPKNNIQARIGGRDFTAQPVSGEEGVRINEATLQRSASGNWDNIRAIRCSIKLPKTACVGGLPLWGGAQKTAQVT